jgi:selT/selW/selH-like putative selenoprotein
MFTPSLICTINRLDSRSRLWKFEGSDPVKVEIEYCGHCGYEPRARAARDLILNVLPSAEVTLRRSGGGVFEIRADGRLAFSKKSAGRFPTDEEIVGSVG